jgi:hypothetical protein
MQEATAPLAGADDFQIEERTIDLPELQNGRRVSVRVRAIDPELLIVAFRGIPAPALLTGDAARDLEAESKLMRAIAREGIAAPEFSFDGPAEGKADWRALKMANRAAITAAIAELSGLAPATGAGTTERFPGEPGGAAAGEGAVRAGEAAEEPQP